MRDCLIVTGGAGFIGSWFSKLAISEGYQVVVLDKLTYAGNLKNVRSISNHQNFEFYKVDIGNLEKIQELFLKFKPCAILNFAAESHVDNSIADPDEFIQTNIVGTYNLLKISLQHYRDNNNFRFIQISTDEIYGSLNTQDPPFNEKSNYAPNSPYAASKAAADHLCRAWFKTYQLPVIITNCSNNFGPFQHEEKLIPTIIKAALEWKDIPIYGAGKNIRDWIYVKDHTAGILQALRYGKVGQKYLFGGNNEKTNLDMAYVLCNILDRVSPHASGKSYSTLIKFVQDRPGHDIRYAIDASLAYKEIGFSCKNAFEDSLRDTVNWYVANR